MPDTRSKDLTTHSGRKRGGSPPPSTRKRATSTNDAETTTSKKPKINASDDNQGIKVGRPKKVQGKRKAKKGRKKDG